MSSLIYTAVSDTIECFRYSSYVGCTILLHSAVQQLLQGSKEDVGLELAYASSHLSILALCSYENKVARKAYTSLQIVFNDLKELLALPVHVIHSPQHVSRITMGVAREMLKILDSSITP